MPQNHTLDRKAELLVVLAEECAEVQKCVTKFLRFGPDSDYLQHTPLELEIGDVMAVLRILIEVGELDVMAIEKYADLKIAKMKNPETSVLRSFF